MPNNISFITLSFIIYAHAHTDSLVTFHTRQGFAAGFFKFIVLNTKAPVPKTLKKPPGTNTGLCIHTQARPHVLLLWSSSVGKPIN